MRGNENTEYLKRKTSCCVNDFVVKFNAPGDADDNVFSSISPVVPGFNLIKSVAVRKPFGVCSSESMHGSLHMFCSVF